MKLFFFHMINTKCSIYSKIKNQDKTFRWFKAEGLLDEYKSVVPLNNKEDYYLCCDDKKVQFYDGIDRIKQIYNWLIATPKLYNVVYKFLIQNKYTHIFIRRSSYTDFNLIFFLKKIKNAGIQIIYEIPTYPYDLELKEKSLITFFEYKYRKKLKENVDVIATYTKDREIFGIKTINLKNGIIVDDIKIVKEKQYEESRINLIAVAGIAPWHGYDRLLIGMGEYYKKFKKGDEEIFFHLVGEGNVLDEYKEIIDDYKIQDKVILYGKKQEDELDDIYDLADIAVEVLGMFRKKIYFSSSLKSREYLAKGLPIITACQIDILPSDCEFVMRISPDESPVDIEEIVRFYNSIYKHKEYRRQTNEKIREFAEAKCDMKIALQPIIEYINM